MYYPMKNKYFRGNQDYTCADTRLIAMLDVIKSTRGNCAGNLKLNDKGSFFHLSYTCRSTYIRPRIRIILFIRSMYLLVIDLGKTKNLTNNFMKKEETASDDVSDDFIRNMKINLDHINSQTIDQKNKTPKRNIHPSVAIAICESPISVFRDPLTAGINHAEIPVLARAMVTI